MNHRLTIFLLLFCLILQLSYSLETPKNTLPHGGYVNPAGWIEIVPVGGILGEDIIVAPFMDSDPVKGKYKDYTGGDRAYDGHTGTDFAAPTFSEQDIGLPIFACANGTVINIADGNDDHNTEKKGQKSNFVKIYHGKGRTTYYGHLAKNSVCVNIDDYVKAGQQIGRLGSSGNSRWPHLHFQVEVNEKPVNPFVNPDTIKKSAWKIQPYYSYFVRTIDGGFFDAAIDNSSLPFEHPRYNYLRVGKTSEMKCFIISLHVAAGQKREWRLYNPHDKLKKKYSYTIETKYNIARNWWWVNNSYVFTEPGIWTARIYIDDELQLEIPVNVISKNEVPPKNRAPIRKPKINFFFVPQTAESIVGCRVEFSKIKLDPELEQVGFHYVWRINNRVVRDVISAGHVDYLPIPEKAKTVKCTVAVTDIIYEGPAINITDTFN